LQIKCDSKNRGDGKFRLCLMQPLPWYQRPFCSCTAFAVGTTPPPLLPLYREASSCFLRTYRRPPLASLAFARAKVAQEQKGQRPLLPWYLPEATGKGPCFCKGPLSCCGPLELLRAP
jgi:hypothetical protein